jgi:putative DNA primase/helicase
MLARRFDDYDVDDDDRELANNILELFSPRTDVVASHLRGKKWPVMCDNYRIPNLCNKFKNRANSCNECVNRAKTQLTTELLNKHISGDIYLGIYPLLSDNTCKFIVADFDNHDPAKKLNPYHDITEFYNVCEVNDIPCYVVRSKGGKGYHVYIFFDKPIRAWKARTVVYALLKEAQLFGEEAIYSSFDQLRPNQDSLIDGKIGNAISLPFQGTKVKDGISVFLDPSTRFEEPYKNQLELLNSILLSSEADLDRIIEEWDLKKDITNNKNIVRFEKKSLDEKIEVLCKCDFLKHCYENQVSISEPEWWMMLSNVSRFDPGGPGLCHEFSRNDGKRYNMSETTSKITEVLNKTGAHTCKYIHKSGFKCSKNCSDTSPIKMIRKSYHNINAAHSVNVVEIISSASALDTVFIPKNIIIPKTYRISQRFDLQERIKIKNTDNYEFQTFLPTVALITQRVVCLYTGLEKLEISWVRDGNWKKKIVNRSVAAQPRELIGLADVGFPVTSLNAKSVVKYLSEFENENLNILPKINSTHHLGWQPGRRSFLWGNTNITSADKQNDAGKVVFSPDEIGDEQVAQAFYPEGSYEQWIKAAKKVMKFPFAAIALFISLSAPFIEVLDAPNMIADWSNPTSTGKTTLLKFAASAWGNPNMGSGSSVITTWKGTNVGIERRAALLHGLPFFLDDTKTAGVGRNGRDTAASKIIGTIYDLSSGHTKDKGAKHGLSQKGFFRTCTLSTGEQPIIDFTNGDGGARARTIQFWGPPFGKNDKATGNIVNELISTISTNFGHAGPRVIEYSLNHRNELEQLKIEFKNTKQNYLCTNDVDGVNNRFSEYFAFYKTVIPVIQKALPELSESINIELLLNKLWRIVIAEGGTADRASAALEYVLSYASAHQVKFYNKENMTQNDLIPLGEWYGRWDFNRDWNRLSFISHKLVKILEEQGYDAKSIIRVWNERGWLQTDTKGFTKKVDINDRKTSCYCIKRSAVREIEKNPSIENTEEDNSFELSTKNETFCEFEEFGDDFDSWESMQDNSWENDYLDDTFETSVH